MHRAMRVQLERCCGEWRELEEEFRQLQVRRALRGRRRERPLRGEGGKEGTGGGNARSPAVRWQRHPGVCDRVPLKHIVPSHPFMPHTGILKAIPKPQRLCCGSSRRRFSPSHGG